MGIFACQQKGMMKLWAPNENSNQKKNTSLNTPPKFDIAPQKLPPQ